MRKLFVLAVVAVVAGLLALGRGPTTASPDIVIDGTLTGGE
jgi:hypothetical protein